MIEAEDDAWETYLKVDCNDRLMRYKSWPLYDDWAEIFGKDRATGEHASDFVEVVNELITSDTKKHPEAGVQIHSNLGAFEDENEIMLLLKQNATLLMQKTPAKENERCLIMEMFLK